MGNGGRPTYMDEILCSLISIEKSYIFMNSNLIKVKKKNRLIFSNKRTLFLV